MNKEVIILNEDSGSYKYSSWGPSGEGERDGFSFAGKKKEFSQAVLSIQALFYTNKQYKIGDVKFSLESKWKEEKGKGQNYSITVGKGDETGKAVLKTWDKNAKKE